MDRIRFALALALLASGPTVRALGASELVYVPLPPCRVLDTRCVPPNPPGTSCSTGTPVAAVVSGGPHSCSSGPPCPGNNPESAPFRIQGSCGVPVGAAAVTLNLAVAGMTAGGYGRIYPADSASVPVVSLINYRGTDGALANGAVVPLGAVTQPTDPDVRLYLNQTGGGTAHVIADVTGYFVAGIDSLLAGTGLTGGGSSGAVTLGLQASYQLPQTCAGGQQPSWLEGGWICQSPAAGTITEVIAGTGLAGGGTSGPVTLSLAPSYALPQSGCSSGQVVKWDATVAAWICADVTPAAPGFEISTVDASRSVDLVSPSITIGSDGLGLISYSASNNVSVAHCADVACTSATIVQPGAFTTDRRGSTSIAIGTDGLGMISYGHGVIHCSDVTCTSAIRTLNGSLEYSSIAIGADGFPLISACAYDFSVAHCRNPLCTGTFDHYRIGAGCESTSIAIGADGLGLITFTTGVASPEIHAAHCDDVQCSTASIADYGAGGYSSITIGSDGRGLISRQAPAAGGGGGKPWLGVVHCSGLDCSIFTGSRLDNPPTVDVGQFNSITLGADGLGLISYYDFTNRDLKVAHCFDVTCSSATVTTLDSTDDVGQFTSITTGRDGFGLIAYIDVTNRNLKVAHCPNALCVPYVWRR